MEGHALIDSLNKTMSLSRNISETVALVYELCDYMCLRIEQCFERNKT